MSAWKVDVDQSSSITDVASPRQWRRPSIKHSLVLMIVLWATAIVVEAVLLVNDGREPFVLQVASKIRATLHAKDGTCSPELLDPKTIPYRSNDAFYSALQSGDVHFPPTVFDRDNASVLCDAVKGATKGWEYCLPVTGRKDVPFCYNSTRDDLLKPLTSETRCFGSALHMLLVDVYEEMKHEKLHPVILYGTLLGAVREGIVIPFTEDADIGYQITGFQTTRPVRANLAKKGYHIFKSGIWRVCIAPNHPLASNLFDAKMSLLRGPEEAPYVDLYEMKHLNRTTWRVAEASPTPFMPHDKIEPFSQVTLNGMQFDTVADPEFLLTREYGEDFMVPKPRTSKPKTVGSHH